MVPTILERSSIPDPVYGDTPSRLYDINKDHKAVRLVFRTAALRAFAVVILVVNIGHAMGHLGKGKNLDLWDDEDGFFYDVLRLPDGGRFPLKIRSMVGLIPLFAVETLEPDMLEHLPDFKRRLEWFIEHRGDLPAEGARADGDAAHNAQVLHDTLIGEGEGRRHIASQHGQFSFG